MAKTYIGGQALLEGVMMRGKNASAMAVRDETGIIRIETSRIKNSDGVWKKIPVIRGVVNFFASLVYGTKTIMRSGDIFMEDAGKKATAEKEKGTALMMTLTLFLSLALAIGLFFFLPSLIISLFVNVFSLNLSPVLKNLIEGAVRIFIFVLYIVLVSKMNEIKRVFMYHGAEHRTINCFESEAELTVENVQKCSTVHDRCGTSFLFFVMFVAIIIFAVVDWLAFTVIGWQENVFTRLALRLVFLPLVAGFSYELLRALSKTDFWLFKPLKWPGALLQKLTTKIPDDSMAEVAIAAFNAVIERENNPDMPDVKFPAKKQLGEFKKELISLMREKNMDDFADIDWILCEVTNLKRNELKDEIILSAGMQIRAEKYLKERLAGKPLQYILGSTEFFGRKFKVDSSVLIPRFETELLTDKALPLISKSSRVLDLCCGSGAIGITVRLEKGCEVVCSDISEGALKTAKENAKALKADIEIVESDLFENISGKFNVILCNPPYIESAAIQTLESNVKDFEPLTALDGGADGLDFYRKIIPAAAEHLEENGIIVFEIGAGQAEKVIEAAQGLFKLKEKINDYNSIERILIFAKV